MKMYQVNEDDLKFLEYFAAGNPSRELTRIVQDIRWNYGPKMELVTCDCDCGTPCPNGKMGMETRCQIWKRPTNRKPI